MTEGEGTQGSGTEPATFALASTIAVYASDKILEMVSSVVDDMEEGATTVSILRLVSLLIEKEPVLPTVGQLCSCSLSTPLGGADESLSPDGKSEKKMEYTHNTH